MTLKIWISSPHIFWIEPDRIGFLNFGNRLITLKDAVSTYYGSQLNNFLILAPGLLWIILFNPKDLDSRLLCIFLTLGAFTLFVGDRILQSRVIYDIPFSNNSRPFIGLSLTAQIVRTMDYHPTCMAYSLGNKVCIQFPSSAW